MAKEIDVKPEYARRGWEYYIEHKIWPNDASVNMDGLATSLQIYWESSQSKGPMPSAAKYVDQSFIKEATKELNAR